LNLAGQDTFNVRRPSFEGRFFPFFDFKADTFVKSINIESSQLRSVTIFPKDIDIGFYRSRFDSTVSILDKHLFGPTEKQNAESVDFYSYNNHYQKFECRAIDFKSFKSELDIQILDAQFNDCSFASFAVKLSTIKNCTFHNIIASSLHFDSSSVFSLTMSGHLPDTIFLRNCRLVNWNFDFYEPENHVIYIDGDFNYDIPLFSKPISRYSFVFGENTNLENAEEFMRRVLALQKEIGTSYDIQKADILLKEVQIKQGNFALWFQKTLWLYGYEKVKLFKWFLLIFSAFYLINLFFFKVLIYDVYKIENLGDEYNLRMAHVRYKALSFRYYVYVFIYSALIYFGLKMSIDKFTFKRLFWTFYIYVFYLIGIFFLFFILGLILNK